MTSDHNLLFVFSLPRSGSTLLQRSLAAQEGVFTAPETWMLVKLMAGMSGISEYSEYGGMWANKGASEFYNNERLGKRKTLSILGESYLAMLRETFPEHAGKYFIEKTPRNSLIVDSIIEAFPNAKFIFLWRHPAAIIHSMNKTWSRGHWHFRSEIDLDAGWHRLIKAKKQLGERAISINYEELTGDYEKSLRSCLEYLGLPASSINEPLANVSGSESTMGDKSGLQKYGRHVRSDYAWLRGYENFYRRFLLRRFYQAAGRRELNHVGYSNESLDEALASKQYLDKYLLHDILRNVYSQVVFKTGLELAARRIVKVEPRRRFGVY